ncbi:hypothetical protein GWK08_03395 [Leptobacterium flavescens]|uniref:Uncharacterized protein n=1 Tax=Leptobacterium flavescens TaxID=472055 RepID=A0A6P0UIV9_9FLAO|nr:hypothetical protein [Leptobacterium flavescens]NER12472.1 hypothetical protein [Leptobacterium flavescens]
MNIFPTKEQTFKLIGDQNATLDRLVRRTEKSEKLTSQYTDKSFRGMINGNQFKIISSVIGRGAFCVMTGEINSANGYVKVEIHKVFRILLSVFLFFPVIGFFAITFFGEEDFSPIFILVVIAQIFMIRYIFIEIAFKFLSKESLNKLRDVLDIEWIKN